MEQPQWKKRVKPCGYNLTLTQGAKSVCVFCLFDVGTGCLSMASTLHRTNFTLADNFDKIGHFGKVKPC